jgi:hypothetical protein
MWSDLGYVGAATPLVIAAMVALVVWRSSKKERARRLLENGLSSPDPDVRRGTLEGVDEHVLAMHPSMFCAFLANEHDPGVLDALAGAVARSRWDPTDDGNIVELRRWVAGRHAHDPLPDPEPPRPAEAPATTVDGPHADDGVVESSAGVLARGDAGAGSFEGAAQPDIVPVATVSTALVATGSTMMEPMGPADLSELVPKIRALLGESLARMELVSIDGEVLATWAATDTPPDAREHEDAQHPT